MDIYKYKQIPAKFEDLDATQFSDVDTTSGHVKGYFTTFDVLDSDGDIGRKGMFKKTIEERGPKSSHPRIKYFQNHNSYLVPGYIKELEEDNTGLLYVAAIGKHAVGRDYMDMVLGKIITEHSYGYQVDQQKTTAAGNELLKVIMWEGSGLTAWGANQFTPILAASKGLTKDSAYATYAERLQRLERFVKNTTATDETIECLMLEIKQLSQVIVELSSTTPAADNAPEPGTQADYDRAMKAMNNIILSLN